MWSRMRSRLDPERPWYNHTVSRAEFREELLDKGKEETYLSVETSFAWLLQCLHTDDFERYEIWGGDRKENRKKKLSVEDSGSMMKRFGGGVVSIRSRGCVLEVTEMDGNKAIAPPTKSEQTPSSESNGLEQSNINLSKLPRDDREGLRLVKYLYGTSWSLMEPRGGSWLTSKERGLG
ncbi:hypothetical protein HZH68_007187 [Vespula germanica]|uniref:Uncharacterized protein n=1 Tax=Vespula germanica TaxID=30212 RepID=A0A834K8K5_VESGE|nr:hypothetical protein HZH68_007187 [Vespula germanica]